MPQLDLVLPAPPRVAPRVAGVPAEGSAEAQQLVLVVRAQGDAGRVALHLEVRELRPGPAVVADPRADLGRELVARLLEASELVRPRVARAVEVEGLVVAPDPRPGDPAPLLLEVPEVHPGGDRQVASGEVSGRDSRAPREAVLLRVHVGEDREPGRHLLEGEDEAHRVVPDGSGVHLDLREDRQVVEPRHVAIDFLDVERVAHLRADLAGDHPVLRHVVAGDVDRGHTAPRERSETRRECSPGADRPVRGHLCARRRSGHGQQEERRRPQSSRGNANRRRSPQLRHPPRAMASAESRAPSSTIATPRIQG